MSNLAGLAVDWNALGTWVGALATCFAAYFVKRIADADRDERSRLRDEAQIVGAHAIAPLFGDAWSWVYNARNLGHEEGGATFETCLAEARKLHNMKAARIGEPSITEHLPALGPVYTQAILQAQSSLADESLALVLALQKIGDETKPNKNPRAPEAHARARARFRDTVYRIEGPVDQAFGAISHALRGDKGKPLPTTPGLPPTSLR